MLKSLMLRTSFPGSPGGPGGPGTVLCAVGKREGGVGSGSGACV